MLLFGMVGALATGVHFTILIALVEFVGFAPLLATSVGYAVGVVVSYALNRRFTFSADDPVAKSFPRYVALYMAGALLNGAVMAGLTQSGAPYLLAQIGATALVLVWNFAGSSVFVFQRRRLR